jgi:hypothetical protein
MHASQALELAGRSGLSKLIVTGPRPWRTVARCVWVKAPCGGGEKDTDVTNIWTIMLLLCNSVPRRVPPNSLSQSLILPLATDPRSCFHRLLGLANSRAASINLDPVRGRRIVVSMLHRSL